LKIILSNTLSYCFGVKKTLGIVEELLRQNDGKKYYMLGEIVHNEHVIDNLRSRGLKVISSLDEIEAGGIVILQSHGAPLSLYDELEHRGIGFIDATCPMVSNIHQRIRQVEKQGYVPVIIGKEGHDEVRGIQGQVKQSLIIKNIGEVTAEKFNGVSRAGIVVQSTFQTVEAIQIVDKIRQFVPDVLFHDTICQPTKMRQREIEEFSKKYDCNVIIGSRKSANTMHLFQIALKNNRCTYLVDDLESARLLKIPANSTVFIASGASTPEELINNVIKILSEKDAGDVSSCQIPSA
jgi:4-hydroxy-3-methylbut-2-enyl diphosphate reductase